MVAAPSVGTNIMDVSNYIMDQVASLLNKVSSKHQQHVSCQLAITEYGGNKHDIESSTNSNKLNFNFTVNLNESDDPIVTTNKILSRRPSVSINKNTEFVDDDTFEHIWKVTSHHEAVMAFYYMDEDNKVKVTEIFDVTDSDSPFVQSSQERETNMELQFDDDEWEPTWNNQIINDDQNSIAGISDVSLDDLDKERNIFSDPESEWNPTLLINNQNSSDSRPESDQPNISLFNKPYKIPSMSYENFDD